MIANCELRKYATNNGVKHWQIAERLGMSESVFCRKMRHEMKDDEKIAVYEAIDQVKRGAVNG